MDSSMKLLELLVIAGGTLWYRTFFRFYWMPITNFRIVTSYSKLSLKRWQRDIHGRILSIESRWPNEQRYGLKVQIQCRSVLRGVVPFGVKKSLANMPEQSPQYWHPLIFAFFLLFNIYLFVFFPLSCEEFDGVMLSIILFKLYLHFSQAWNCFRQLPKRQVRVPQRGCWDIQALQLPVEEETLFADGKSLF